MNKAGQYWDYQLNNMQIFCNKLEFVKLHLDKTNSEMKTDTEHCDLIGMQSSGTWFKKYLLKMTFWGFLSSLFHLISSCNIFLYHLYIAPYWPVPQTLTPLSSNSRSPP